jgi:ribosomal protein L37AE/L43A
METLNSNAIQMELKYCERCGALWLRLAGSDLIFCPHCSVILAGLARDPRFRECRGSTLRNSENDKRTGSPFWSEGGNA